MNDKAMFKIGYGLYILTASENGRDNGCIVNTLVQVTSSPNRVTIAVNKANYTAEMISRTKAFNVSMLTVTGYAGKEDGQHLWRCKCDCGKETVVRQTNLQSGKTKSCGCLQEKQLLENLKLCEGTSVTILEAGRRRLRPTNTSGVTGVYRNRRTGRWCAQITFKRKTYYLGAYEKKDDAIRARKRGEGLHENFIAWYYATHQLTEGRP